MESNTNYSINLDIKYGNLTLIDIPEIVESCNEKWFNQSLCRVNECVVRIGILEGEFHWHKHDDEDEFFFVIDGKFFIELENETIKL
ncbi:cupin domain-containing protein, partial [candidate division KSB1 bacterium]